MFFIIFYLFTVSIDCFIIYRQYFNIGIVPVHVKLVGVYLLFVSGIVAGCGGIVGWFRGIIGGFVVFRMLFGLRFSVVSLLVNISIFYIIT